MSTKSITAEYDTEYYIVNYDTVDNKAALWYPSSMMASATTPDFSGMVKKVRTALGLSQTQFAQLLGVTPPAVFLWERGERQPEGTALRLIYALHQRLDERQPKDSELDAILKAIAVGAAAVGFITLLGALFSTDKK